MTTEVNAMARYEAIADLYYRRFGRLAPGKSEPLETAHDSNDDENRAQFSTWLNSHHAFEDAIARIVKLNAQVEELTS